MFQKNKRSGFTIIELMCVLFIMSLIMASLYGIFRGVHKITKRDNNKNSIYLEQVNFYRTLNEDIKSGFLGLKQNAGFDKLNLTIFKKIKKFEGDKTGFSFIIKKRCHLTEKLLKKHSNMDNKDTGWYKVKYELMPDANDLSKSKLIRKIHKLDSGFNQGDVIFEIPMFYAKKDFDDKSYINFLADINLYNTNGNYKEWFLAYYDGSAWKKQISVIPEKILVQPKFIYKDKNNEERQIRFRFIIEI